MKLRDLTLRYLLETNRGFVLVGHGVDDRKKDPFVENLHQDLHHVKSTLLKLKSYGFQFINLKELMELEKDKFRSSFPWIHLSFDDGYKNNLTHILPMVTELEIPISVFLSTYHIFENERMYTFKLRAVVSNLQNDIDLLGVRFSKEMSSDERIYHYNKFSRRFKTLSAEGIFQIIKKIDGIFTASHWEEINEKYASDQLLSIEEIEKMAKNPMVDLGAHSHHHILLNQGSPREILQNEIETPKKILSEKLGYSANAFAYPNGKIGDFSKETEKLLEQGGYQLGFTAIKGLVGGNTNKFSIPRNSIPNELGSSFFPKLLGVPFNKLGKLKFLLNNSINNFKSQANWEKNY